MNQRNLPEATTAELVDAAPPTLHEFLPSDAFGSVGPSVVDLQLIVDATFRVSSVAAQPDGCDALGHSLLDLVTSPVRQGLREAAERCVATGSTERISIRLAVAPQIELAACMRPFESADGTGLVLAAVENVTQNAASDAEFQLEVQRDLLDVLDVAIFSKDRESRFLGANEKLLKALGVEQLSDALGKTDYDFFPAEEAAHFRAHDVAVMSSGEPVIEMVEQLTSPDGTSETLVTTKLPVRNADGDVIGVIGYFRFVTDAIETKQELRSLEGRHALALQASREGIWEFDLNSNMVEVTERFAELVGLDPPVAGRVSVATLSNIFGADGVQEVLDQCLAVVKNPALHVEFKALQMQTDSGTRFFEVMGYPLVEDGEVTRLIGTLAETTEDVQREHELLYRANHDALTGLANRHQLFVRLNEELDANELTFLLYLDLDQFKVINDSLGHGVGDELLQAVSARLSAIVDDEYLLARLGGDEFAIVGRSVGASAEILGEAILEGLSTPLVLGDTEIYTSASIGLVYARGNSRDAIGVLRDADTALYEAKEAGKSCIRTFEREMRRKADQQLRLQNRIRRALKHDEFELHYQPIMCAESGTISGVEALLRWKTGGELHAPAAFLPYLEQSGLIVPVGEQVIRDAIAQFATWITSTPGGQDLAGSLNLSRVQFRSPSLLDVILETLGEHNVSPSQLVIEVTETAMSDDVNNMVETLQKARDAGIRVAVDDFGVGQSSLSSLYELPADILKIDKAFVGRIEGSETQPVIEAILAMARAVGLTTTAEGVETQTQRAFLESAGCDYLQGFLFGRPVSPAEMTARLRDQ